MNKFYKLINYYYGNILKRLREVIECLQKYTDFLDKGHKNVRKVLISKNSSFIIQLSRTGASIQMSQKTQKADPAHPIFQHNQDLTEIQEKYDDKEKILEPGALMFSIKQTGEVYQKIVLEGFQENNNQQTVSQQQKTINFRQGCHNVSRQQSQQNQDIAQIRNAVDKGMILRHLREQEAEVKVLDDGYHKQEVVKVASHVWEDSRVQTQIMNKLQKQTQAVNEEDKANEMVERYENVINQNNHLNQQNQQNQQKQQNHHKQQNRHNQMAQLEAQSQGQTYLPSTQTTSLASQPLPNNYNSYLQALLNTPINLSTEPTEQDLEFIHQALKQQLHPYQPEQIYILLYNNLIKAPRQALIQAEAKQFDPSIKYDGGHKYWAQINSNLTHSNKYEMSSFELRKQIIKVYVTKGYGLKVFQQHLKSINPQAPQIDKQKFKKHFIEIYKITMRRVQEFLTNSVNRQFQPLRKDEYQKPLSDVINCKKHYPPQFCQVFYRILQATFDINYENVPNQEQVIFFYKTIMQKLRGSQIKMVKKLHQHEEEKDTDIWTPEFELMFITIYINCRNLADAKARLIEKYPETEAFLISQKLIQKIQNAIRAAIRYLVIKNAECGNMVSFEPTDMDKKFIMAAKELQESRIKLLKVYVKKPTDAQVLSNIVSFIHDQLKAKYEIEKVPPEVIKRAQARQLPRQVERSGLESLLKSQLVRKY